MCLFVCFVVYYVTKNEVAKVGEGAKSVRNGERERCTRREKRQEHPRMDLMISLM